LSEELRRNLANFLKIISVRGGFKTKKIMKNPLYQIRGKVWIYPGKTAWHFVNVSKKQSQEIKKLFGEMAGGWGSLPVKVGVDKISWNTSIFPDKKSGKYLLPLKAEIRKKKGIVAGQKISYSIEIRV